MKHDDEFKPIFSDDHLQENPEPGPLQAGFRAYTDGGKAGLTKFLLEQEAKANRNSPDTPTTTNGDAPKP